MKLVSGCLSAICVMIFLAIVLVLIAHHAAPPYPAAQAKEAETRQAAGVPQPSDPADESDGKGVRWVGYAATKKLLPGYLKNPDSAEFDWQSVSDEVINPGQRWKVRGIVRATNSFNTIVAQQWTIVVTYSKDTYYPIQMFLGDKLIWQQ